MIKHFKSIDTRFLSNFYLTEVEFEGHIYPSSEHAYMSAKSDEKVEIDGKTYNWKEYCRRKDVRPGKIKGESRFLTLPDNWDTLKLDVMYRCLVSKFSKEPLRGWLLATGTQIIQEGNWHGDKFWGVDLRVTPNVGENNLGKLLMRVRDELKRGNY
jgi:ribA/ribD-fused uncharacterized protein